MKHFFISYNSNDAQWAEWIAFELEEAGYTTVIQAWDFRPGGDFVVEMQKATTETEHTIAVLSEDYLNAEYTQAEWAVAFARDPRGNDRTLIPIRIAQCNPTGLLATRIFADLVGLSKDEARKELVAAVGERRGKPFDTVPFPGSKPGEAREASQSSRLQKDFPGKASTAVDVWREKLEFLRTQDPIAVSVNEKLWFKKRIEEVEEKIANQQVEHVVILIHGSWSARTRNQSVQRAIGSDTVQIVAPPYGWLPFLRFLAPWDMSKRPVKHVYLQYLDSTTSFPNAKISVIAHRFGGDLLTRMLQEHPNMLIYRVILCSAVIRKDFRWEHVVGQIGESDDPDKSKFIVNDCGQRDIWPALCASAGWQFRNVGSDGVKSLYVRDRFHLGGNSLFVQNGFIKKYWKPFLTDGTIEDGDAKKNGEGVPRLVKFVTRFPLRYLPIFVAFVGLAIAVILSQPSQVDVTFDDFVNQLMKVKDDQQDLREYMNQFQGKEFLEWEACIEDTKVTDDWQRYQVWKCGDDKTERVTIWAYFSNGGAQKGERIKFSGVIKGISDKQGVSAGLTQLDKCQLLDPKPPEL